MERDNLLINRNTVNFKKARQLNSRTIRDAVGTFLVRPIVKECNVLAVRCIFSVTSWDVVVEQIAAKRRQLELEVNKWEEVSVFFLLLLKWIQLCS